MKLFNKNLLWLKKSDLKIFSSPIFLINFITNPSRMFRNFLLANAF